MRPRLADADVVLQDLTPRLLNPAGFFDQYDMGRSTHRNRAAEGWTAAGRAIGDALNASDYFIMHGAQLQGQKKRP